MRYYYKDEAQKQILVFDRLLESTSLVFLGESDWPNIKARAAMFLKGEVGYKILSKTVDQV